MFEFDDKLRAELWNLYHLAKTALVSDPDKRHSSGAWAGWAADAFHKAHPECASTRAYKEITRALMRGEARATVSKLEYFVRSNQ